MLLLARRYECVGVVQINERSEDWEERVENLVKT